MEAPSLAPSPQLQACGKALLFLPAWFSWGLLLPWEMGRFSDGRSLTMMSSYPSFGRDFYVWRGQRRPARLPEQRDARCRRLQRPRPRSWHPNRRSRHRFHYKTMSGSILQMNLTTEVRFQSLLYPANIRCMH